MAFNVFLHLFHSIYSAEKFTKCHRHNDGKMMRLVFSHWVQIIVAMNTICHNGFAPVLLWFLNACQTKRKLTEQDLPVVGGKGWVEACKKKKARKTKDKSYWELVRSKTLPHSKTSHKFDDGLCIGQPNYAHNAIQAKNVFYWKTKFDLNRFAVHA